MADTLFPPCTSWCPFWWWRCSGSSLNRHLCALCWEGSQGDWDEALLCSETSGSSADWSQPPRWSWSCLVKISESSPPSSRSSLADLAPFHQLWSWEWPRFWSSTLKKVQQWWGRSQRRASFLIPSVCFSGSAAVLSSLANWSDVGGDLVHFYRPTWSWMCHVTSDSSLSWFLMSMWLLTKTQKLREPDETPDRAQVFCLVESWLRSPETWLVFGCADCRVPLSGHRKRGCNSRILTFWNNMRGLQTGWRVQVNNNCLNTNHDWHFFLLLLELHGKVVKRGYSRSRPKWRSTHSRSLFGLEKRCSFMMLLQVLQFVSSIMLMQPEWSCYW